MLESYNDLQEQLEAKDREIEDIKLRHTKDIGEFDVMVNSKWKAKEKDYQKEIKNLEVLLSKTEGGMENVTMARSKSVVHGTRKAADLFEDGMEKIKQNFARYSSGRGSSTTTSEWDTDQMQQAVSPHTLETSTGTSYLERQEDVFQERTVGSRRRERSTQDTESFYSTVDHQAGSRLTSVQLDALERQNATSRRACSRSVIIEGQAPMPNRTPKLPNTGTGISIRTSSKEKPLPDIPVDHSEMDPFLSSETEKGNTVPSSRLSYVMNNEDEFVTSPRITKSSFQSKPSRSGSKSTTSLSTFPGKEQGNYTGLRPQLSMGLGKGIERVNSTSSIVTAVRDNSRRSGEGRPARGNGNGAKKGQGAAVMAAVRAIAASNKNYHG
ncbi:hypothetical protein DID88_000670 [Monilinia fructigena]|uniref:Uncharacterized protein n=1 Tax=Monilinia fructigena TaxID=38457 RepID=A0A395IJH2_9HELO|nr:hypothetical protein DID88_000670 [Monilinia fructigena]